MRRSRGMESLGLPERAAGPRHRHGRKPAVDARHSVSLIALINKGQSGEDSEPGRAES